MRAVRFHLAIACALSLSANACSQEADGAANLPEADTVVTDSYVSPVPPQDATLIATLSRVGSSERPGVYDTATTDVVFGSIDGTVEASAYVRGDTAIASTIDMNICRPFVDVIAPRRGRGVGNAIVWLAGVDRGIPNSLPRRTSVRLDKCTLVPRVHVVAAGGTVIVGSRDALSAELRIADLLRNPASPRALVSLNDFGQVVPSAAAAREPGLVQITDDRHPWVRGFVAVSAHPYVAVTDASGRFRLDSIPVGYYQLVVFSEKFGVRSRQVKVSDSASSLTISFDE